MNAVAEVIRAQARALRTQADALDALAEAIAAEPHEPRHEPAHEVLYATASQYAERMHVSLRTVRSWTAQGLPTVGSGRTRRIDVQRADAWLAARSDDGIAALGRRDAARAAGLRAIKGGAS